jgi:hypothetical protein
MVWNSLFLVILYRFIDNNTSKTEYFKEVKGLAVTTSIHFYCRGSEMFLAIRSTDLVLKSETFLRNFEEKFIQQYRMST